MKKIVINKSDIKTVDIDEVLNSRTQKFIGGIVKKKKYILMPSISCKGDVFVFIDINDNVFSSDYRLDDIVYNFEKIYNGELFSFNSIVELMDWFNK